LMKKAVSLGFFKGFMLPNSKKAVFGLKVNFFKSRLFGVMLRRTFMKCGQLFTL
jgi:hypothetical protein